MENEKKDLSKNAWNKYDEKEVQSIFEFCEGYKNFMSKCKTERECVKEVLRLAKAEGYEDIEEIIKNNKQLKPGDKVFCK